MVRSSTGRAPLAPKVPEITLLFWLIKVLTTGMGEAMSDFLGQKSVPLAGAVGILGLVFALRLQLRQSEYRAPVYWFAVMMVAVFGTMAAYVVTRPLGASFADWFGKPHAQTGLGLGDGTVSGLALLAFTALVAYAAVTRRDVQRARPAFSTSS